MLLSEALASRTACIFTNSSELHINLIDILRGGNGEELQAVACFVFQ